MMMMHAMIQSDFLAVAGDAPALSRVSKQRIQRWQLEEPAVRSVHSLLSDVFGAEPAATEFLCRSGSLTRLLSMTDSDFEALKIGPARSRLLVAFTELFKRAAAVPASEPPHLNTAPAIAEYMAPFVIGLQVEKFWVLCLNRKNRLLRRVEISSGTATAALAHPREVFREAIRESSTAIVCIHNHPSGDPAPSAADVQVTRQLAESARTLDIELLDHVIVGRSSADPLGLGYYSFRNAGML